MRRIKVYDSICSCYNDVKIYETCRQFTRMISALIQVMAHVEERKKVGASAFSIYKCLAIGITFEGLCDSAMPDIRLKLVAEIFDEVPDSGCFIQMSDPRGVDTVGVEFISQNDPS
ncbi:hypothetical protein ARALYDRAFT_915746 [Arabidopsis lyrata subsp. lyrata]|uniref:Ubiquitin-like protease family profile domain-containing protein n=1 Tax=Arabidopsis lyrata subsp. lyrata TaxID=81972 RepID=D7MHZ6_ARALL|nr:hypothetical protein ARALYDRAFT_915746 [Arabidopsis lyrata subsp. lyrata]